jgi:hypothetical protein
MRSTGEKAEELKPIADWLKSAGAPEPPPLSRLNLIKLLRWLAMNWVWTALFVGAWAVSSFARNVLGRYIRAKRDNSLG